VDVNNALPVDDLHALRYYLLPGGIFRREESDATRDPVLLIDDHSVWLVSSQYVDANAEAWRAVIQSDGTHKFFQDVAL